MGALYTILSVVLALVCVGIVIAVLLQKKRDAGFSGSVGGVGASAQAENFDKTKKRTTEGRLERLTKLLGAVFMILALVIALMA
ncbi:MAG: preprotein translocase subunit SecG [Defluviitaleaceae bacterium]|nr:preprotein translocase subunit SecG [Defluviitaleaceae bacterium]